MIFKYKKIKVNGCEYQVLLDFSTDEFVVKIQNYTFRAESMKDLLESINNSINKYNYDTVFIESYEVIL